MQENKNLIHELSLTTYQWLTASGNKANKNFLKDEFSVHLDCPALINPLQKSSQKNIIR